MHDIIYYSYKLVLMCRKSFKRNKSMPKILKRNKIKFKKSQGVRAIFLMQHFLTHLLTFGTPYSGAGSFLAPLSVKLLRINIVY